MVHLLYVYFSLIIQLDEIIIKYTDEAPEKTKEECCPGVPYISFSTKPAVSISAINPQVGSGLFKLRVKVSQGDTAVDIASNIVKQNKSMKGM